MKQRIISSLVGLALLAVVLCFFNTPLLNAVMALISLLALYELFRATGCASNNWLMAVGFAMSLAIPFIRYPLVRPWMPQILFLLILAFFAIMLRFYQQVSFEKISMAFLCSTFVPLFFSCAVFMREDYGAVRGGFYLVMALAAAWLCDTGAYFVGTLLGKHKLAPRISPKKTVEGSVGGIVAATALMPLLALGYGALMQALGYPVEIHYLRLMLMFPLLAVVGMMGDLTASAVKRQFGIKDFGNIMPGHGGVLDRFDSALFTLPAVYILVQKIPVISLTAI